MIERTFVHIVHNEQNLQHNIAAMNFFGGGRGEGYPWQMVATMAVVMLLGIAYTWYHNRVREKRLKERIEEKMNALMMERRLLQTTFDTVPDLIIYKDKNLRVTRVNKATLSFYGLQLGDVVGYSAQEAFKLPNDVARKFLKDDLKVIRFKGITVTEEVVKRHDGELIDLDIYRMPVIQDGEVVGTMSIARDVTQRKRLESKALAASAAKTQFLAHMSHEIRTPLNAIIGFSELSMDLPNTDKAKEYLADIKDNGNMLLKIINDILDVSKIEAGKMTIEFTNFDLKSLIDRCYSSVVSDANEKNLEVIIDVDPRISKKLMGDSTRLAQIFINLLSNAVKFTQKGMIKFDAKVVRTTQSGEVVHFDLQDTGIGMTNDQISRVYEPFMQADESIARRFGGTGLGLPICGELIKLMGGEMVIESEMGKGTKFSFELEFGVPEYTPTIGVKEKAVNKPIFDAEILLCEDNKMNQKVMVEHLIRVGIKVVVASNGVEGVNEVQKRLETGEKPFDLIMMDINMPIMDGLEATKMMNELGVTTPKIAVTANVMASDYEKYKTAGLEESLGKPFTTEDLWECLLKFLKPVRVETILVDEEKSIWFNYQLNVEFLKSNKDVVGKMEDSIKNNDIESAYIMAHTLKSNAGQLNKKELAKLAADVEKSLKNGEKVDLEELSKELKIVVEELELAVKENTLIKPVKNLGAGEILEQLELLESMLKESNPESLAMLDKIRHVEALHQLIEEVEDFEFKTAYKTLLSVKANIREMD